MKWCEDAGEVVDFGRVLVDSGALDSAVITLEFFADPAAYSEEHRLWEESGRPTPPSPDDLAEARLLGLHSDRRDELIRQHAQARQRWEQFTALLETYSESGRRLRPL